MPVTHPGRRRLETGVEDEPVPIRVGGHPNRVARISQRSTNAKDRGDVSYRRRRGHEHTHAFVLTLWLTGWGPLVEQVFLVAAYGFYPDGGFPRPWLRVPVWLRLAAVAVEVLVGALLRWRIGSYAGWSDGVVAASRPVTSPCSRGFGSRPRSSCWLSAGASGSGCPTVTSKSCWPNAASMSITSHLYRWVQRFTPLLIDEARPCRHVPGGRWFVDETYVKVVGTWRYVHRAVDQYVQVVDVFVSERRDIPGARRFFKSLQSITGDPEEVVTDRSPGMSRRSDSWSPEALVRRVCQISCV
jgi:hypothetical protein